MKKLLLLVLFLSACSYNPYQKTQIPPSNLVFQTTPEVSSPEVVEQVESVFPPRAEMTLKACKESRVYSAQEATDSNYVFTIPAGAEFMVYSVGEVWSVIYPEPTRYILTETLCL